MARLPIPWGDWIAPESFFVAAEEKRGGGDGKAEGWVQRGRDGEAEAGRVG
jgi:hypothetical protein